MRTQTDTAESHADRVLEMIRDCLYRDAPLTVVPEDTVRVEGIVHTFGFDPKRIKANKPKIEALIKAIVPEPFYKDGGGGWSFLNLCNDKHDKQWADDHATMEALYVLAAAIGRARFCMPREWWAHLPGGVPYVQFDRRESSS